LFSFGVKVFLSGLGFTRTIGSVGMRSVLLLLSPIKLSPVHFFYKNFGIGNTFTPVSYFFSGLDPFLSAFLCALLGFALINGESEIPLDFF
jgi:hypothetical protein